MRENSPKNTISVDIGGTFTDCFVVYGKRIVTAKSPTTHHNLSIGFLTAVKGAARELGLDRDELLGRAEIIRYSTTIPTNTLIQRTGPKLGLITTKGFEDTVTIGRSRQWADGLPVEYQRGIHYATLKKPVPLVLPEMVAGVDERIDCFGQEVMPLSRENVRNVVQHLVDSGARGFVVALLWSHMNPAHEQLIRSIIEEEYPEHYLGALPIILSSEVLPKLGEYPRTNAAILNSYLHQDAAEQLTALGDELRNAGYTKPLVIVHNSGGTGKVSRTMAYQLYGAGPVAGLLGGVFLSQLYGYKNLILTDVGGTSFDLGLIADGQASSYQYRPVIDRWLVALSTLEVKSIGVGGGSIAHINYSLGNQIEIGPQSAGSMPGPACYGQGGKEPTLTDADVILGYINPKYFLGGRISLGRDRAIDALKNKIAEPLGLDLAESAAAIRKIADANMGAELYKETALKGHDPRDLVLVAYGGAGPTHCCGFASELGVRTILTLPFSSVFCAFGAATMDIMHTYEKGHRITLDNGFRGEYVPDYTIFNEIVDELQTRAIKDMRGEGFSDRQTQVILELDMKWGTQLNTTRIVSPRLRLEGEKDAKAVCSAFEKEYARLYSSAATYPESGIEVENLLLKTIVQTEKPRFPRHKTNGTNPTNAFKGKREVFWQDVGTFQATRTYERKMLRCGNRIDGPGIIEAEDTTIVLPQGFSYTIDQYLNGVINRT